MRRVRTAASIVAVWLLIGPGAAAPRTATAPRAAPLTLGRVLAASARHSPTIIEALTKVRQAEGKLTSAQGAFDVVFGGDAVTRRLAGFYDGTYAEARVTRPFETNNGGVYGGYRVSEGRFPVYEDRFYTQRAGDVFVGGYYSLLRDRYIDDKRAKVSLAAADIAIADFDRQLVAIGVQRRAVSAYQTWVAAGQRLGIYRALLRLALDREDGLERLAAAGQRASIVVTENRTNIVRRRTLLVRTEAELAVAANELSFFYRDAEGAPITPTPAELPGAFPRLRVPAIARDRAGGVLRPDLDAITARLEQADTRRRLAENDLRPKLELKGEVAQGIGPEGSGGASREGLRAYVGLTFQVPLQRRDARGRIADARAEIEGLRVRRRGIEEQIAVDVRGLVLNVDAANRLRALAEQETALAEQLAAAERKRFGLGVSDLIILNQREETAADARLRQLDVEFRVASTSAELVAAAVDRGQLGLEPGAQYGPAGRVLDAVR